MSQINQYIKIRTALTLDANDLMDLDSTDDAGVTFESAQMTIANLLAYINANGDNIYNNDGAISATRTLSAQGFDTTWVEGNVIVEGVEAAAEFGFRVKDQTGTEKAHLIYDKTLVSSEFSLSDAGGEFLNAANGLLKNELYGPFSGLATMDMRFLGVNDQFSLYTATHTALGVGTGSFLDLTTATGIQFGHKQSFFSMVDSGATQSIFMGSTANFFVDNCAKLSLANTGAILEFVLGGFTKVGSVNISDNDSSPSSTLNLPNFPTTVSAQNSTASTGVINSVVLGGVAIAMTQSNTAFVPDVIIQTGKTFESDSGGSQLDLRQGADNVFALTNDLGAFAKAWYFGDDNVTQWGFGNDFFGTASSTSVILESGLGASNYTSLSNQKVGVLDIAGFGIDTSPIKLFDNTLLRTPPGGAFNSGIAINNTAAVTFNAGVKNATAIGFGGIVKTNDSLYIEQLAFNAGDTGEILLKHTPNAANFIATLQAATGTIALLSDIPTSAEIYTPTNVVTDRAYDANATTLDELADVVGTLIADLQAINIIQ